MAGFAMDIGDAGSQYAQGVAAPSATEAGAAAKGLQIASQGLFGVANSFVQAQQPTSTTSTIPKQARQQFIAKLDSLKGVEDPVQVRSGVLEAYSQLEGQGYKPDSSLAESVKMRTGIDVNYLSFDPDQAMIEASIKGLQENTSFLFVAEQELEKTGKPYTQQDVTATALELLKQSEAAATYLATAKNIDEMKFRNEYLPQANTVLDNIRNLALVGLSVEQGGGTISPESLMKLRDQFSVAKATFNKPANVSTENWQAVQGQIDTLDALLTRLETYDETQLAQTSADLMNGVSKVLIEQAKGLSKTDPVLAKALLSDKVDWSAYASSKWPDVMDTLKDMKIEQTQYTDLPFDSFQIKSITDASPSAIPETVQIHDADEITKATDLTPKQRLKGIEFALTSAIRVTKPEGMNQEEHRANFLQGVGQATVSISTSNNIVDQKLMNELFNDDVYEKLAIIKKLDPEGYQMATARMKDALMKQYAIRSAKESGTAADNPWTVSPMGKLTFTPDPSRFGGDRGVDLLNQYAKEYYNGDLTAMAKDGAAKGKESKLYSDMFYSGIVGELTGIKANYQRAQGQLNAMNFYKKQLSRLGMTSDNVDKVFNGELVKSLPFTAPEAVRNDRDFLLAVDQLASDINARPEDLLRIMSFETGGSFDPAQLNLAGSSATGLIQFIESTAKDLGTTTTELAGMTRTEQMVYVSKYMKQKLKNVDNPDIGDLYMAVLMPSAVGKPNNHVIISSGDRYEKNKGLDINEDGMITKGEAVEKMLYRTSGDMLNERPSIERIEGIPEDTPAVETPDPTRERQTGAGEASVSDQGLLTMANSDFFNQDVMRYLQSIKVDPEKALVVEGRAEYNRLKEQGLVKKGDFVVVVLEDGDMETIQVQ